MLFVNLLTYKPNLTRQQIDDAAQRRARWKYPSSLTVIGEYWLQGSPNIINIIEAESIGAVLQANYSWLDIFQIQTHPAVNLEDGLRLLQQAGVVRRRGRRPKNLRL